MELEQREEKVWGARKIAFETLQAFLEFCESSKVPSSLRHHHACSRVLRIFPAQGGLKAQVFCECWEIDTISFLFLYYFCRSLTVFVIVWIGFVVQVQALQVSQLATGLLSHRVKMFCVTVQGHPGVPGYPGLDGVEGTKVNSHMKTLKRCFCKDICMNKCLCPSQTPSLPLYDCDFQYFLLPRLLYRWK